MRSRKRILISVGEESGAKQASLLLAVLNRHAEQQGLEIEFFGPKHPLLPIKPFYELEGLAAMGLPGVEKLTQILNTYKKIRESLISLKIDGLICVDYTFLNLRLMEDAKRLNLPVIYFIPPKLWAHSLHRITSLKKYCDLILTVLPFETDFFKKQGLDTYFVGNPLKGLVDTFIKTQGEKEKIAFSPHQIALLPGSRSSEMNRLLPLLLDSFLRIKEQVKDAVALIPVANSFSLQEIRKKILIHLQKRNMTQAFLEENIKLFTSDNYFKVIYSAQYVFVCSGTASLEVSFFKKPASIVYKTNAITFFIGSRIIKVPYIGLPNLVSNCTIYPEFIQDQANTENLVSHALPFLTDPDKGRVIADQCDKLVCHPFSHVDEELMVRKIFETLKIKVI